MLFGRRGRKQGRSAINEQMPAQDPSPYGIDPETLKQIREDDTRRREENAALFGDLGYMVSRGVREPEYVKQIPTDQLLTDIYNAIDRMSGRVDHQAHERGEAAMDQHAELLFIAQALQKVACGEPVEANPFIGKEPALDPEHV